MIQVRVTPFGRVHAIHSILCCTDTICTSSQMPSEASIDKETHTGKRNMKKGRDRRRLGKKSALVRSFDVRPRGWREMRALARHTRARAPRGAPPPPLQGGGASPFPPPLLPSLPLPPFASAHPCKVVLEGWGGGRGWRGGAAGAGGRGARGADAGIAGRLRRKKDGSPRRRRLQAGGEGWGRAPCRRGAVPPGAS